MVYLLGILESTQDLAVTPTFFCLKDTLVAMQALTEYSYRARLRDITDMRVQVEATGEKGRHPHKVQISNSNVSEMHFIPVSVKQRRMDKQIYK